jgi:hypothetical protein
LALESLEGRLAPATLTVNSTSDTASPTDPYLSLREAVAIVNSPTLPTDLSDQILARISGTLHEGRADTIVFEPTGVTGPILLSGTQLELTLPGGTAQVTIDGGSGVTVDGAGRSRVLAVDSGVQATLEHLTISHGNVPGTNSGGGILNTGSLTVSQSTLSANSAFYGGGIDNDRGTLTVNDTTLASNSGSGIDNLDGTLTVSHSTLFGNSNGIYNHSGTVTVSNCTLSANSGFGIYNGGTVTVSNSTLSANSAFYGGGISSSGTLTVSNCTLTANYAAHGGGISIYDGTATVSNCTLSANSAVYEGGGIYSGHGTVTVSNCTLSANSAPSKGGGISNYYMLTVTNCTLAANSAASTGGGIFNDTFYATLRLQNTLVAGNHATGSGPDLSGAVVGTSAYNLVGDGTGLFGIGNGLEHNQVGTSASPIDPRLSPLGYYGGPTPTFALLPGSPARDAGEPDAGQTADQRGLPRPVGGASDVGAFQTQPAPFLVTTLTDPGRLSGLLSLREAVALANVLPGDATISFADPLDGGAVTLAAGQLELSGSGGVTTIDGAGRFTLDGGNRTRLVQVDPGTTAVLRGLALVNGNAPIGAGLYNRGTLTVADCVLYGNTAYSGGAVLNQGVLTVAGCTVGFNVATFGAGLANEGDLFAVNSTLLYNAALAAGGAVYTEATGNTLLTSLTVSLNSADTGGGLDAAGGDVLLSNCIVAGNYNADATAASDIAGTVDGRSSYNLIGTGGSGGLADRLAHNRVGVADPGLTAPDFTSPQTPAFGLTPDSPARGAGDPTLLDDPVLRLDQHGNVRTVVNIGAV